MRLVIRALGLVACLVVTSTVRAAEKWADPRLPVPDGLDVWFDATTLAAASEADGSSPPRAGGSGAIEQLNVEGRGFSGARDRLNESYPFGTFQVLSLSSCAGESVKLFADAKPQAERPRTGDSIRPDELRVGARWANPGADKNGETGYLDGAIAEVLVYHRRLSDDERAKVEQYLTAKHAPLLALKVCRPARR